MKNYSGREVYASHYLDEGDYGATYIYDDIVIKKYCNNNSVDGHIKPGIVEKIKEIDNPAFIKLLDCTYGTIHHYDRYEEPIIKAYSSKFVERISDKEKVIDMPMEYTINSIYELTKVAERLTLMGIRMNDEHCKNIIPTKDNLVVIDPDNYFFGNRHIGLFNMLSINDYITDLWCDEYGIYDPQDVNRQAIDFYLEIDTTDGYMEFIQNKLNEKTPRDLMERVLKRK